MSVGMAAAGGWLAATFNRPDFTLFDYNVYAMGGDGCMMEGVSSEAASLAGHLRLSNLCWIYDNNRISIEGPTDLAFTEDVATRFLAYGWSVTRVGDANDLEMLTRAYETFLATRDRPTLIIVDSHIGYGSPHRQDTRKPTARRSARTRSGWRRSSTAGIPMPSSWCPTACGSTSSPSSAAGAESSTLSGTSSSRRYQKKFPEVGLHVGLHAAAHAAARLGQGPPDLSTRSQGHRQPRRVGQGGERDRAPSALDAGRRRRTFGRRPRPG